MELLLLLACLLLALVENVYHRVQCPQGENMMVVPGELAGQMAQGVEQIEACVGTAHEYNAQLHNYPESEQQEDTRDEERFIF